MSTDYANNTKHNNSVGGISIGTGETTKKLQRVLLLLLTYHHHRLAERELLSKLIDSAHRFWIKSINLNSKAPGHKGR